MRVPRRAPDSTAVVRRHVCLQSALVGVKPGAGRGGPGFEDLQAQRTAHAAEGREQLRGPKAGAHGRGNRVGPRATLDQRGACVIRDALPGPTRRVQVAEKPGDVRDGL